MTRNRFWQEQGSWPTDPPGWIFLARATVQIGNAMFVGWGNSGLSEWEKGVALQSVRVTSAPPPPSTVRPLLHNAGIVREWKRPPLDEGALGKIQADHSSRESEQVAHNDKFHTVQEQIRAWAESGELPTGTRPTQGGAISRLEPVVWSTQSLSSRFSLCQMHPRKPYDNLATGVGYCHIFVGQAELVSLLARRNDRSGEPEIPARWNNAKKLRKPYVERMAELLRTGGARSRNDAAKIVAQGCWREIKAASEETGLSGFPCVGGRLNITPPWL